MPTTRYSPLDRLLKPVALFQTRHGDDGSNLSLKVAVVQIDSYNPATPLKILAADYFDDETIIVVCQVGRGGMCSRCFYAMYANGNGPAFVSTFPIPQVTYQAEPEQPGFGSFESVLKSTIDGWKAGNVCTYRYNLFAKPLTEENFNRLSR